MKKTLLVLMAVMLGLSVAQAYAEDRDDVSTTREDVGVSSYYGQSTRGADKSAAGMSGCAVENRDE